MIADDNPNFNARAAIGPFLMKVALPWRCVMRTDNSATTTTIVWSPTKAPQNSTLSGNITNSIVDDTARADMPFSTIKVDLSTLANDDPSITVPMYTLFPVRQDRPREPTLLTTSPGTMKVTQQSDRKKLLFSNSKGRTNVALNRD